MHDTRNVKAKSKNTPSGKVSSFGELIAIARVKNNLTMQNLVELIGKNERGEYLLSLSYISKLESGEKNNPSFHIVCLLTQKLHLDLKEVVRIFGFDNLLSPKGYMAYDDFKEIVLSNHICCSNISCNNLDAIKECLSKNYVKEKELLYIILREVIECVNCSNDELKCHTRKLMQTLKDLRRLRQGFFDSEFYILDTKFTVKFSRAVEPLLYRYGLSPKDIVNSISNMGVKLNSLNGSFKVWRKDLSVEIIGCITDNVIEVIYISSNIKEVE